MYKRLIDKSLKKCIQLNCVLYKRFCCSCFFVRITRQYYLSFHADVFSLHQLAHLNQKIRVLFLSLICDILDFYHE